MEATNPNEVSEFVLADNKPYEFARDVQAVIPQRTETKTKPYVRYTYPKVVVPISPQED